MKKMFALAICFLFIACPCLAVGPVGGGSGGGLTDEVVQDQAGGMWTGNTETGISIEYQDDDGTIDATVSISTSEVAAGTLVTEAEGISSNDNDTTVPTSAAVKDYADSVAGATISSGRISGLDQYWNFTIPDPASFYAVDTQICIEAAIPADLTITRVQVTCDADPTTELDMDLYWADSFIGFANAALIVACDTTAGAANITSGFSDATIASGKTVYLVFAAEPDENITQIKVKITYDFD